jgi:hypothetical protein
MGIEFEFSNAQHDGQYTILVSEPDLPGSQVRRWAAQMP